MAQNLPISPPKEHAILHHFLFDLAIWLGSIVVSSIPAVLQQVQPISALKHIPFGTRLITDLDITYSFITGITVLTIQMCLIEGRNEYIKKNVRKPVLFLLAAADFLMIAFYSHLSTLEYHEIEEFFRSDLIIGGAKEANTAVIITIVFLSFVIMLFHSLPKKLVKLQIKETLQLLLRRILGD